MMFTGRSQLNAFQCVDCTLNIYHHMNSNILDKIIHAYKERKERFEGYCRIYTWSRFLSQLPPLNFFSIFWSPRSGPWLYFGVVSSFLRVLWTCFLLSSLDFQVHQNLSTVSIQRSCLRKQQSCSLSGLVSLREVLVLHFPNSLSHVPWCQPESLSAFGICYVVSSVLLVFDFLWDFLLFEIFFLFRSKWSIALNLFNLFNMFLVELNRMWMGVFVWLRSWMDRKLRESIKRWRKSECRKWRITRASVVAIGLRIFVFCLRSIGVIRDCRGSRRICRITERTEPLGGGDLRDRRIQTEYVPPSNALDTQ